MKKFQELSLKLLPLVWALGVSGSQAATLGNVRNVVFVGRAFVANIELDLGDSRSTPTCITPKLNYGDTPVTGTRYTINGNTLRVRNNQVIDEPIVTLTVTLDCQNPVTRSYTLLAEAPMASLSSQEAAAESAATDSDADTPRSSNPAGDNNHFGIDRGPADYIVVQPDPQAPAAKRNTHKRTRRPAAHAGATEAAGLTTQLPALGEQTNSAANERRTASQRANKPTSNSAADKPRLELDNFDWVQEDPGLHASPELLSAPSIDPKVRQDARARWAALNAQMGQSPLVATANASASPEQAGNSAAPQEVLALTEAIEKRDHEISQLKAQISREQNSNARNWWILLDSILCLISSFFLVRSLLHWRERREARASAANETEKAWWQHDDVEPGVGASIDTSHTLDLPRKLVAGRHPVSTGNFTGFLQEALPLPEVEMGDAAALQHFPEFSIDGLDEAAQLVGANQTREATEELLDLQQQADFFLALGQQDKAIELLRNHIHDTPETSPLAYLDLLALYHGAARQEDYSTLRRHFNGLFNANVPSFANYKKATDHGLEHYSNALARIQAHWNTPKIIQLIEESVFRREGEKDDAAFDPMAYRELLMLYGIATETLSTESNLYRLKNHGKSVTPDFDIDSLPEQGNDPWENHENAPTALAPLSASIEKNPYAEHLDLDLDLDLPVIPPSAAVEPSSATVDFDFDFPPSEAERSAEASQHGALDFSLDDMDPPVHPHTPPKKGA